MERIHLDPFTVSGISVRTKIQDELDPQTAKIGPLWQHFLKTLGADGITNSAIYGIYTCYASDENGPYNLMAAVKGEYPSDDKQEITIPAGPYLKFEKAGPPQETAMALWQEIWNYFQQETVPKRTFDCDFEAYSDMHVAIYIGIRGAI